MGKTAKKAQKKAAAKGQGSSKDGGGSAATGSERRKGKPGKQRKRGGGDASWGEDQLERELAPLGLRVKPIEADGNCFFRSVSDQLEGEGGDHMALRGRVVGFIEEREEEYKFFIEDDEPFDKYVKRMRKDGAWAGHLELQATSMLLQANISVYQAGTPVWRIQNFGEDAPTLHLGYKDGMHYDSVRMRDDYGSGPPEPIRVRSAAELAAAGAELSGSQQAQQAGEFGQREVDRVVAGTGCTDRERIVRVLGGCGGDVEAAIEALVEQLGQEGEEGQEGGEEAAGAAEPGQEAAEGGAASVADGDQQQQQQKEQQQAGDGSQQGAVAAAAAAAAVAAAANGGQEERSSDGAVRLQLVPEPGGTSVRAVLQLSPLTAQQQAAEEQQQQQQQQDSEQQAAATANGQAAAEGQHSGGRKAGKKGVKVKGGRAAAAAAGGHVGRNTRCPCGSTRKYKNCCGVGKRKEDVGGAADGRAASAVGEPASAVAAVAQQLQVMLI